jgi:protein-tyrosine kinase
LRGILTSDLYVPLHGLLGYLSGGEDFASCAYTTSVPGLILVPAGGSTRSGPALFASPRLRQFILDARSSDPEAQLVFDLPPILATPETQIISHLMDAILMVVAANDTPRASVARALELIKDAKVVGVVLNRFEPSYSQRASYEYKAPAKRKGSQL